MTPAFYSKFQILKRALDAFNARCSCEKAIVSIAFSQQITTDESDPANLACETWMGSFSSNIFTYDVTYGTVESVSEYLENLVLKLGIEIIEAMAANIDEWYPDRPEIKSEIFSLYSQARSFIDSSHPKLEDSDV